MKEEAATLAIFIFSRDFYIFRKRIFIERKKRRISLESSRIPETSGRVRARIKFLGGGPGRRLAQEARALGAGEPMSPFRIKVVRL